MTNKIAIPILGFARAGGIRVLTELANNWIRQGQQVFIIAYYESDLPYFPLNCEIIWIDRKGKRVDYNIKNNKPSFSLLRRMVAIYKYLKENYHQYDTVLANHSFTVWPIFLSARKKCIYYIQAYEPEFYRKKGLLNKVKEFMSWTTYFLPICRVVNADIYTNYKNLKSKYIIYPGLDLDIFKPKEYSELSQDIITIGCIGRKQEFKGAQDVSRAVDILRKKGIKIKFKVAFEEVENKNYDLIKPHGDLNLAEFYRSLDILIAPGHIQLGAVHYPVIEAMASKTIVVTTGYYPANESNAYIVPIKRPDIIADKVIEIINEVEIRKEKIDRAYSDILPLSWDRVSKDFISIIQNIK